MIKNTNSSNKIFEQIILLKFLKIFMFSFSIYTIITDHKLHSKFHNYKSSLNATLNSEHIQVLKICLL